MHYALAGFAILCIFLGMLGTFWIRSNARRQEIGVMRSMGASRHTIIVQFLTEAALLVTLAFVCSLPLLYNYIHMEGLFDDVFAAGRYPIVSDKYWVNSFGLHFGIVTLITYLILLFVSLIGTFIPVVKAANILPADALRDE
jgi:ABC-type antimicrobial peptide transport system permease subunit